MINYKLLFIKTKFILYTLSPKLFIDNVYIISSSILLQVSSIVPANTAEIAGITGVIYFMGKLAEIAIKYKTDNDKMWIALLESNTRLQVESQKASNETIREQLVILVKETDNIKALIQNNNTLIRELQTVSERNRAEIYKQELARVSKHQHTPDNVKE